jgi:Peptidyl-tRNA hydrolase PTH2
MYPYLSDFPFWDSQMASTLQTVGTAVIISAVSLGLGFYLGSTSRYNFGSEAVTASGGVDESGEDIEVYDGDLAAVNALGPCKLVLVVRTDLGMKTGKISAQYVSLHVEKCAAF